MLKHIIMVNPTTYELRLIARNRGIKNYQNMSREKLLSTLDESEHILKIYHKIDLSEFQKSRIFHKISLSKSQKSTIFYKINLRKLLK